jgi:hypothetical protein
MRGARAAVLTVPTVGTAAVGHSLVDGCGSLFAVVVATGLCWPAAVALVGSRRGPAAIGAWVLAAQVALHLVFASLCSDGAGSQHLLAGVSPSMLAAHLAAAVTTALFLARADAGLRAAHALMRAASRLLRLPRQAAPVVVPAAFRRTPRRTAPVVKLAVVLAQPSRRGPPVPAALAS